MPDTKNSDGIASDPVANDIRIGNRATRFSVPVVRDAERWQSYRQFGLETLTLALMTAATWTLARRADTGERA